MEREAIENKDDLITWLREQIVWFHEGVDFDSTGMGDSPFIDRFQVALQECYLLGLPDGVEALGCPPTAFSGEAAANTLAAIVYRKFAALLDHLTGQGKPLRDGPDPRNPFVFWWKGDTLTLPGKQSMKILHAVWGKEPVSYLDLALDVWDKDVDDGTIRTAINRLNEELGRKEISFSYRSDERHLFRDEWAS